MSREDRIRKLQLALIRALNNNEMTRQIDDGSPQADRDLLSIFGEGSRPLVEALYEALGQMLEDRLTETVDFATFKVSNPDPLSDAVRAQKRGPKQADL